MEESMKVCIRCLAGAELREFYINDNGAEVGVIYCCRDCFDVLRRSSLDIFVSPVKEDNENLLGDKTNG